MPRFARIYSNENFPMPVVNALRGLGHDIVTTQDRGQAGNAVPDEDVLKSATKEGRAVLTLNRKDFIQLHRRDSAHSGIIVCTVDHDAAGQAERIHSAIQSLPELSGHLVRVNRPNLEQSRKSD